MAIYGEGMANNRRRVAKSFVLKIWRKPVSSVIGMIATVNSQKKKFSPESLEAADRLLKAVKGKLLREKGRIDYVALRRDGYSDDLIARLKQI